jgi:hypothetical protein
VARQYALALMTSLVASIVLASGAARAEWEANAKVEHFRWAEDTQPGVTETGPRFGIGLGWTQDRESGWLAAWRGELYGGSVEYNGAELFPPNNPIRGTTEYTGFITELQGIYRSPGGNAALIAGLGFDYWNRQLTDVQKEEWYVTFARLGVELGNRTRRSGGVFAGGGVKYPLYIAEDAHLNDIGFDSNPKLHPGRAPSLYAEIGYRFSAQWALTAYYDSYRFRESPAEHTSVGGAPFIVFQPQSSVDTFGLRLHVHF